MRRYTEGAGDVHDLELARLEQLRIFGKGRKERRVPIHPDLGRAVRAALAGPAPAGEPTT